jgi:hypothetical protein
MNADDAPTDEPPADQTVGDASLRQLLHAATGDRDAEARALADRAGEEPDDEDARRAVSRAHGDRVDLDTPEGDIAGPGDARATRE